MVPALKKYKAAAVNAEPGWFDLQESVRRTIHWINEAGENGCKLIAFPELCKCHLVNEFFSWLTQLNRDSRIPVLGLEGELPGEPSPAEEVP